ncbi:hypothetical protein Golob_018285, partial [Gossypium lobatum]|nr:hypothetical protein [Gossypium lobatum]
MSEQWVTARIKQKADSKCIPWKSLQDLILAYPDTKKRVDVFALSIYGLVIFPKVLGSLSACRRADEERFIGCAQLLLAWFHRHFWKVKKVSYRVFSENYFTLKESVATPKAPWLILAEILYRYEIFNWVPLLRIWGAIGYTPLLVLRQYRSRQFITTTQGLAQCEFTYKGDIYKKKVREISNAWNRTYRMKRFAANPMTTPEYDWWWGKR